MAETVHPNKMSPMIASITFPKWQDTPQPPPFSLMMVVGGLLVSCWLLARPRDSSQRGADLDNNKGVPGYILLDTDIVDSLPDKHATNHLPSYVLTCACPWPTVFRLHIFLRVHLNDTAVLTNRILTEDPVVTP